MIRRFHQWLARRRLAKMRAENIARQASDQPRHHNGRFARIERKAA